MTGIGRKMKEAGYATHFIGKRLGLLLQGCIGRVLSRES